MQPKSFAVFATVVVVLSAFGSGVGTVAAQTAGNDGLAVAVTEAGNSGATVTVTENETAVSNASVAVEALDNVAYEGTGNYTTADDGTVDLPEPEQGVAAFVTENNPGTRPTSPGHPPTLARRLTTTPGPKTTRRATVKARRAIPVRPRTRRTKPR